MYTTVATADDKFSDSIKVDPRLSGWKKLCIFLLIMRKYIILSHYFHKWHQLTRLHSNCQVESEHPPSVRSMSKLFLIIAFCASSFCDTQCSNWITRAISPCFWLQRYKSYGRLWHNEHTTYTVKHMYFASFKFFAIWTKIVKLNTYQFLKFPIDVSVTTVIWYATGKSTKLKCSRFST